MRARGRGLQTGESRGGLGTSASPTDMVTVHSPTGEERPDQVMPALVGALTHPAIEGYVVGEELMRQAFDNAASGSYILGSDARILRVNQAFCDLVGWESDDVVGREIVDLLALEGSEPDGAGAPLHVGEVRLHQAEQRMRHKLGHPLDIEITTSVIGGLDGRPAYTIGHIQDVTERRVAAARIAKLAMQDPLTELPNRALFLDRLEQGLRRLGRGDSILAVFFIDLDRFKQINDIFGHPAGDLVLVEVAARLRRALRPDDTLARFGGDEFTILCEGLTDEAAVVGVAERVLSAVASPLPLNGQRVALSASVGVALATDPCTDVETMFHDADVAMYQAKERGRNRWQLFDEHLRAHAVERIEQTKALRLAIDRAELRVFFQPFFQLADNETAGVEALIRWEHPEQGLLSPTSFIALAEESGQIMELGTWVLREACREVAAWTPGFAPPQVSVNLSAQQLGRPEFVDTIRETLTEHRLDPGRLCLEITESVLMDDVELSTDALRRLKCLGVRIAIDDFGTGYSSLSYLRRFAVDVVKIDRSFVEGLGTDSASDAIVAAVVNVAHALGLTVVAEGVENEEQLVALRALGCDAGQGYHWSRPLAATDLRSWQQSARPDTLRARAVAVYPLLAQRVEALRGATGRHILLQAPQGNHQAFADPTAIKIVLDHLLSNAVSFSPPDKPVIVTAGADRRWLRVSIADYGLGMSVEATARCFEQFWQARGGDASRPRRPGIGLSIVRSLVEAMGGHVAVKSALGKGSTFTFALPRRARSAAHAHSRAGGALDVGEPSSIQEFMRQIGVPMRRDQ